MGAREDRRERFVGTFHEELADAVKMRQKAINGVVRWQAKKAEAEARIEELSAQRQAAEEAPIPVAATEDGALISPTLAPTFGISH